MSLRQAELRNIFDDISKIEIAMNTFKVKYNAVPGDMKDAADYWSAQCPSDAECRGDGDAII